MTTINDGSEPWNRRILFVTDRWPALDNGHGIRVANVLNGLVQAGSVHVCLIDSSVDGVRPDLDSRFTSTVIRAHEWPRWVKAIGAVGRRPAAVRYRHTRALRDEVTAHHIGRARWDLIWCGRARVHMLTRFVIGGPRIVDFDDLNDRLLRTEMQDRRDRFGYSKTLVRNLVDGLVAPRWQVLQHRIAAEVERVVVCSEIDREHLAVSNAAVVPNGYPYPDPPVGSRGGPVHPPVPAERYPSLLFVGPLTYEPNRLAVQWIIDEVLPLVRLDIPDISFVVIGDNRGVSLRGRHTIGLSCVGHVEDVGPYYERATVAVAPIHSGGGTRLKVIEALARRVPLVSTSFGFEGLDVRPGRDLLVADDPVAFSSAFVAIVNDKGLRSRLVESGFDRYRSRLTASATSESTRQLAIDVLTADRKLSAPVERARR